VRESPPPFFDISKRAVGRNVAPASRITFASKSQQFLDRPKFPGIYTESSSLSYQAKFPPQNLHFFTGNGLWLVKLQFLRIVPEQCAPIGCRESDYLQSL
jgi:hypothetical protein